MDGDDVVKHLIITGVKFTDRQLASGEYGRIVVVDYNGSRVLLKKSHLIWKVKKPKSNKISCRSASYTVNFIIQT